MKTIRSNHCPQFVSVLFRFMLNINIKQKNSKLDAKIVQNSLLFVVFGNNFYDFAVVLSAKF